MELTFSTIRARSERQAMDWSLVLASQGIGTTLERDPDSRDWLLVVDAADHVRAVESIRQYRLENRRWHWRRELPGTGLVFHWGALVWSIFIIMVHAWSVGTHGHAHAVGMMVSAAVERGEWWRLFTAVSLHADPAHLVANATTGLLLLGLAMARYGPGIAALTAFLGGAVGNLAGLWLHAEVHRGVGASGMVMAALGLLAVQSLRHWHLRLGRPTTRFAVTGLLGTVLLLVLLGTSPGTDIVAHLGGFAGGALLGAPLAWLPETAVQGRRLNYGATLVLLILFLLTWGFALEQ